MLNIFYISHVKEIVEFFRTLMINKWILAYNRYNLSAF